MSEVDKKISKTSVRWVLKQYLEDVTLAELRRWLKKKTGSGYTTADKSTCVYAVLDRALPKELS
jgi:hypothetical protein